MNISSMSSAISSITAPSGLPQVTASADQGDPGTGRPHRAHGGGHMHQAVTQALQSLGLSPANSSTDPMSSTSTTSTSDGSDASASSSSTSSVGQDLQQFMHSLFEAVRSESSASTSTSSGSGDGQSGFASGLSALVSQVSSGSAPADLQSAFSKLASDLQGTTPTSAASSGTGSTGSGSDGAQASLQAFLTQLQNNLGYGSSSSAALGNLVATQV